MLRTLEEAFETGQLEAPDGTHVAFHSHTSREQGFFLQEMFQIANPTTSVEVGLAFGISTLFILESHRKKRNAARCHVAIEPFPDSWGGVAEHNAQKERLEDLLRVLHSRSEDALQSLVQEGFRCQFAYVDTEKKFDVVLNDFRLIDKMLDIAGIIVLDDCGGGWPGVQRVARFIHSLPHYRVLQGHYRMPCSARRRILLAGLQAVIRCLPGKRQAYPTLSFCSDVAMGLDYKCLAFQKVAHDSRPWDWDAAF